MYTLPKINRQNRGIWLPSLVVFLAVMSVVIGSYLVSLSSVASERREFALAQMEKTENTLSERLSKFNEVIRGGVGLFNGSESVTREDWRNYINGSQVIERYGATQGIGYVQVVDESELSSYLASARRDITSGYNLSPEGSRDSYALVKFIEPLTDRTRSAIGFDMYTVPGRRDAMEAARDNNDVQISDAVPLLTTLEGESQFGFLMFAPHYQRGVPLETKEQRQAAIKGYVYVVFRTNVFLQETLSEQTIENFGFIIRQPSDNGELVGIYKSYNYNTIVAGNATVIDRTLKVSGSDWEFQYVYQPGELLATSINSRPASVLFFGSFAATLISLITYLLLRGKSNQLALAKERETNEAKDSLLSIASHQLRTPATGVKQYVGMLLQGFAGDISMQQKSLLEKAYESNERQLKTINEVLYLARLDSGRIVLSKTPIKLRTIVSSLLEELQDQITDSGHSVVTKYPKKHVLVEADEHMIRMALENLITNAVKYTHNGGKITIRVWANAKHVHVSVADNGVGIRDENLDDLFKQFSRIPNELTKSVSGTGIGLHLAKRLVELHDGTIEITTRHGVGSTFTISLPKHQKKL